MGNLRAYRLSLELLKSISDWLSREFSPRELIIDTKGNERGNETYFSSVCFELQELKFQFGCLLTVLDGIDQHISQGRSLVSHPPIYLCCDILYFQVKLTFLGRGKIVHRISLRNEETLVRNGLEMQRIAATNEAGSKEMAEIAKQSGEDARAMKVVSFVTMFYLPGTFVAVRAPLHLSAF